MKKILLGAGAAALLAVPAIALYAHSHGKMPMMMPDMTRAQMEAKVKEMFAGADANKDGVVTQDEMKSRMDERREDRIEDHFKAMDKNADGSISHESSSPRIRRWKATWAWAGMATCRRLPLRPPLAARPLPRLRRPR